LIRILISIILHPVRTFQRVDRPVPPAVLQDPTLGQHRLITLQDRGIKLHYVANGSPESPLMLFVHGFPEFWYVWRHQMREFASDYYVVAIDQRGYGDSDKPCRVSDYHISQMVADIKSLIPALGFSSATVVAHDWGSPIVWTFAMKHPDLIDKMVQMNGPHPLTLRPRLQSSLKQFLKSWYIFFFQCPFLPEFIFCADDFARLKSLFTKLPSGCRRPGAVSPEDLEAYVYTFQKNGLTGPINYYRASDFQSPSKAEIEAMPLIDIPTLIIWGTADLALESSLAADSAKFHRNCTVRYIEGASHWVQQDQPEAVNDFMRKFLRGGELRHK